MIKSNSQPQITGFISGISKDPINSGSGVLSNFDKTISSIVAVITISAGIAFIIYFVFGALTWVTSGGKADQLEKAKSTMSSALIGLFVTILTIPTIYIIGKLVGLDILNPSTIIPLLMSK